MIPAAIERNYPKRLLKAGWWHMSLFQQPANPDPTLIGPRKYYQRASDGAPEVFVPKINNSPTV